MRRPWHSGARATAVIQPLFIPTCRTSVPCSRTSRVSLKKLKSLNFRCDSQFLKLADDIPLTLGSRNEKGLGIDPRAAEGAAGSWAGPRWSTVPWRPGQAGEGGPGTPPRRTWTALHLPRAEGAGTHAGVCGPPGNPSQNPQDAWRAWRQNTGPEAWASSEPATGLLSSGGPAR